jgi:predicted MPP superfamily phosphohydrolase
LIYWLLLLPFILAVYYLIRLIRYMSFVEPFNIEVTRHEVTSPHLPTELDGMTICQISDLHICPKPRNRDRAAEAIRGIRADLFVLTGDMIYGGPGIAAFLEWIDRLGSSLLPAVAVLGNAEHKPKIRTNDIVEGIEHRGIPVLLNSCMRFTYGGTTLQVVGVDDPHSLAEDFSSAYASTDSNAWTLLLCHSPDGLSTICSNRADLMLCGHTHGGQVCISPNGWRWSNTKRVKGLVSGWYGRYEIRRRVPSASGVDRMYVSRGIGMGDFPLRLNARPEVAVFVLRRDES